jgi:hypothetical protein
MGDDRLIYAMRVTEKIDFQQYWEDKRFLNRVDNIYHKKIIHGYSERILFVAKRTRLTTWAVNGSGI